MFLKWTIKVLAFFQATLYMEKSVIEIKLKLIIWIRRSPTPLLSVWVMNVKANLLMTGSQSDDVLSLYLKVVYLEMW